MVSRVRNFRAFRPLEKPALGVLRSWFHIRIVTCKQEDAPTAQASGRDLRLDAELRRFCAQALAMPPANLISLFGWQVCSVRTAGSSAAPRSKARFHFGKAQTTFGWRPRPLEAAGSTVPGV